MACLLCQSFINGYNQQNFTDLSNSLPEAADDDFESNDSYDQATPLQNISYYSSFILQDIDWFVISLNAGENITIMIQTDSVLADMEINFYENDGVTLVTNAVTSGNGTLWMIAVPNITETALYYFSLLPLEDPFAYYFEIITGDFDDIYEENDFIEDAVDISENFEENLLYCFDNDWYKIYLEEGWSIDIVFYYYKTGSFELNLIGTDGTTILNGSVVYYDYDEIIYEVASYDENVINTTGYYYIYVSSDTPTIYMIAFQISGLPFEDMPISLNLYQYGENEINIYWSYLEDAEFYYVFRETSTITTVDGLTPYAIAESPWYLDIIEEYKTYYYVVMGYNGTHNSSISNCANVTVRSFEEISITLYLEPHGQSMNLDWGYIQNAGIYYVFRETSQIITIDGLIPIATTSLSRYNDFITENGTFYYVVIANNGTHNSSISNCVNETIIIYPFNEIVPELEPIVPSNDEDGNIYLDWNTIYEASFYYVFRETSSIITLDGLTPIASSSYSGFYDQINENGTYYYVIVANNGTVNGSISNCESVTCSIIPFYEEEPYITTLSADWEQTGHIRVYWTDIKNALEYYVYRDTVPISDIGGLDPIVTVNYPNFEDQVYNNGTYYYVIVANNGSTNSTPSSCKSIEVSIIPFYERIPYLYSIYPQISSDGIIALEWSPVPTAVEYYIFRETTVITAVDGLTPIATIPDSGSYWGEYEDIIEETGNFYYVIVANNGFANSQISECRGVIVVSSSVNPFEELAPILFEISPNPSYTGIISIEWEKVEGSTNYHIYRETSPITSIDGLTPIDSVFDQYNQSWYDTFDYIDNITESGTYYYVVVADNGDIYSAISNCESVEVFGEGIKIPGFNILTFGLVISCTASIIIVSIRKRRNSRKI